MTKNIALCLFAFILLVPATLLAENAAKTPFESPTEYGKGLELFFMGDHAGAEKILREAFEKNPTLSPPGIVIAHLYNEKGQEEETRAWLETTANDYPDDPEAYLLFSQIAWAEDRYTESKLLAEYGIAKAEKYSASPERKAEMEFRGLGILANIEEHNHRWENTITKIERMLALQPEHPELNARLAVLLFRAGKTEAAITQMDKARTVEPENPPGLIAAAEFFFRAEKLEESEKYLRLALEKYPEDWHVLQIAAWLEIQKRDIKKAGEYIAKARNLSPKTPKTILTAGFIALYENNYTRAEELFQQVLFLAPDNPQAFEGLALALCEQEGTLKHERALFFARSNEKNYPSSADALCTLAWVFHKTGSDRRELTNLLTYISHTGKMTALGAYCYGLLYEELDRRDDAIMMLERSLSGRANFTKRKEAEKLLETLKNKEN